jgi:hypothetical protein
LSNGGKSKRVKKPCGVQRDVFTRVAEEVTATPLEISVEPERKGRTASKSPFPASTPVMHSFSYANIL